MNTYCIVTTAGDFNFNGKYCRDLETDKWHYYERDDKIIIHFRKDHIVAVIGDTAENILMSRKEKSDESITEE